MASYGYGKRMLQASLRKAKEKPPSPTQAVNKQQMVKTWLFQDGESSESENDQASEHSEYQPSESEQSSEDLDLPPFEDSPPKNLQKIGYVCEDSHQSSHLSVEYPMLLANSFEHAGIQAPSTSTLTDNTPTHSGYDGNEAPSQSQISKAFEKEHAGIQAPSTSTHTDNTPTHSGYDGNEAPSQSQISRAFEKVTVAGDTKIDNRRNYRKPDYCFYCKGLYVSKISNHYLNIHGKESRVREIAILPSHSKERTQLLTLLQNDGNHLHNCMVLQEGYGELTVSRRPSNKESARPENYLPCVNCKAWIFRRNLSLHAKKCPAGKPTDKNYVRNSEMLLSPFISLSNCDVDLDEIFDRMKETVKFPGLKDVCKRDDLIKEFCRGFLHRLGPEVEQRRKDKDNVRTKIRAVARLVSKLNEKHNQNFYLDDYIKPKSFMDVVNAVKEIGVSLPNLSLTLGNYIKQICLLKKSVALQAEDQVRRKEAEDFDLLFQAHWNKYVSAVCLRRLKLRSLNKTVELPSTSDLVKLKDFLDQKIGVFVKKFELSFQDWVDAAQAIMCRIILFNKRRVSEVEELKVKDLTEGLNSSDSEDILAQMDFTERALAKRMTVVEVRGKSTRGIRKVFIILSDHMSKACFHLLNTRLHVGIDPLNPYLFARCEASPLDGCQAMRIMSESCPNLDNPERIRTRLLRKHLATTVQILDMTESELKMVADHMGHSVSIHTDVYRMQSSLLEKTKVARALMALESGQMYKFSGRTLASCQLEELPVVDNDDGSDTPDMELEDDFITADARHEKFNKKRSADDSNDEIETTSQKPSKKTHTQKHCDQNDADITSQKLNKKPHTRKRWDLNEERILCRQFKEEIRNKVNPSTDKIMKVQQEHSCLKNRSLAVIKSKINNIILGKCKLPFSVLDVV